MCRISSRYPFPQFPSPYQTAHKRRRRSIHPSRVAAFFHMFLPTAPRTLVLFVRPFRVKSMWLALHATLREVTILVRCSNARTSPRLAVLLVKAKCASRSCHRVANTELLPPITVTSRCAGSPSICAVLQTLSLFAGRPGASSGALYRTAPAARRYHDLSSASLSPNAPSHGTSHILSAH
jgi:hypothetical protein